MRLTGPDMARIFRTPEGLAASQVRADKLSAPLSAPIVDLVDEPPFPRVARARKARTQHAEEHGRSSAPSDARGRMLAAREGVRLARDENARLVSALCRVASQSSEGGIAPVVRGAARPLADAKRHRPLTPFEDRLVAIVETYSKAVIVRPSARLQRGQKVSSAYEAKQLTVRRTIDTFVNGLSDKVELTRTLESVELAPTDKRRRGHVGGTRTVAHAIREKLANKR